MAATSLASHHALGSTAASMREAVAKVIEDYGSDGCIMDEVFTHFTAVSRQAGTISGRFSELEKLGVIFRNGETRPGVSGRQQMVMRHALFATTALMTSPPKEKRTAFIRGMMMAAKIVLKAGDYNSAKNELAKELKSRLKI